MSTPSSIDVPVKVLYTFDDKHSVTCLAKSPGTTKVQLIGYNTDNELVGILELKYCLLSIARSSPEIPSAPSDWSVYSIDHTEFGEPHSGQGYYSRIVAAGRSKQARQPAPVMITGKVRQVTPTQQFVEVSLRLTAVPGTTQESCEADVSAFEDSMDGKVMSGPTKPSRRRPAKQPTNPRKRQKSENAGPASRTLSMAMCLPQPSPSSPNLSPEMPSSPPALPTECDLNPSDGEANKTPETEIAAENSNDHMASNKRSSPRLAVTQPAHARPLQAVSEPDSNANGGTHTVSKRIKSPGKENRNSSRPPFREQIVFRQREHLPVPKPEAKKKVPPVKLSGRERVRKGLIKSLQEGKIPQFCCNCGAIKTSCWRQITVEGGDSRILCNACGVYWRQRKQMRPEKYWNSDLDEDKLDELHSSLSSIQEQSENSKADESTALRRCQSSPPCLKSSKENSVQSDAAEIPDWLDSYMQEPSTEPIGSLTEQLLSESDPFFHSAALMTPKRRSPRSKRNIVPSPSPWRHGIFDAGSDIFSELNEFVLLTPRRQLKHVLDHTGAEQLCPESEPVDSGIGLSSLLPNTPSPIRSTRRKAAIGHAQTSPVRPSNSEIANNADGIQLPGKQQSGQPKSPQTPSRRSERIARSRTVSNDVFGDYMVGLSPSTPRSGNGRS